MQRTLLISFLMIFALSFQARGNNKFGIIPYPQQLTPGSGNFVFDNNTAVFCDKSSPEFLKLAQQFTDHFNTVSGWKLSLNGNQNAKKKIVFKNTPTDNKEGYKLTVTSNSIVIEAGAPNGCFYALQTLYQMLPTAIYKKTFTGEKKWTVACVNITDAPRFAYRGMHLDVGRHFFPIEFIKKYIDAMAIHKFNTFHWHLTEDQGWRIEIKKYPRLTSVGSIRQKTVKENMYSEFPHKYDEKPYGGYYTQDQAREIVKYAKERFINVIPEIEMPSHSSAAIAAYPFLSCRRDSTVKVVPDWGVFKDVYCTRDSTFKFMEDVLTEIMDIFPSEYIHIGGDECPKDRWKTCPDCQGLMKKLGLKNEMELQSYFIHRIEKFLNGHGRKIIGWDEILEGGLAPNALVMSWRGIQGGIEASKAGHYVIMTPGAYCYFDHYQGNPETEPLAIGGYLPIDQVYNYEPVPDALTPEQAKYILGSQANVWTEYISSSDKVEYMVLPRMAALSEVLWCNKDVKNWNRFTSALPDEFKRLEANHLNYSRCFYDVQVSVKALADNKLKVKLTCDDPKARILYSLGKGTKPNLLYSDTLVVDRSTTINAAAFSGKKQLGKSISEDVIVSKITGLPYTQDPINTWYRGDTPFALTDGKTGGLHSYDKWIAVGRTQDATFIFDLKQTQTISLVSAGMLSAPAMCAYMSPAVSVWISTDGTTFSKVAETAMQPRKTGGWIIYRPEMKFAPAQARYVKLLLQNCGTCDNREDDNESGFSQLFLDEVGVW